MSISIDVDEEKWSKEVLNVLLMDRTTGGNIIWGTDDYAALGEEYAATCPILYEQITGKNAGVIQPRVLKTKKDQKNRTRKRAEVFTPSWVCNLQNNMVDDDWFGREGVFNTRTEKTWVTNTAKIEFPKDKNLTWQTYVEEKRLEITCGEAPYLASRYDTVSGEPYELSKRIGLLDRKMRVVYENTDTDEDWMKWAEIAVQGVYGFEFQGDNLLIARENILASYCDYYEDRFKIAPSEDEMLKIAEIVSWNLWQMDGLTYTIPYKKLVKPSQQLSIFIDEGRDEDEESSCLIRDWTEKKNYTFLELLENGE